MAKRIYCDHCGQVMATIKLVERPVAGGGLEQRFRCEHCQRWYLVATFSAEGVRLRSRIQELDQELVLRPDDAAIADELSAARVALRGEVRGPNG